MPKLTHRLEFRVDELAAEEVKRAAMQEDLRDSDFCRKLFRWAMLQYKKAGTLHALKTRGVSANRAE